MSFDTALTIISDAATELGLGAVPDAFGSTDANVIQLCGLLKSCGQKLRRVRAWKQLQRSYVFQTSSGQGRYALPVDYGRFIPESAWNRTNRLPLQAITPQDFQALKARLVGVVYNILFRMLDGNFQAFPDVSTQGGWIIAYEYTSDFWVAPYDAASTNGFWPGAFNTGQAGIGADKNGTVLGGFYQWTNGEVITGSVYRSHGGNVYTSASTGTTGGHGPVGTGNGISDGAVTWNWAAAAGTNAPTANNDAILLDSSMMSRALKLAWLQGKGLDTAAAAMDFNEAQAAAFDDDSQGKTLFVTGNSYREPLVSGRNFPLTGFGQ